MQVTHIVSASQVLLNSRVEHDNSAGSSAVEPSVPASESGRSGTATELLECQSVAASQARSLEQCHRSVSLSRPSASSHRTAGRSDSLRSGSVKQGAPGRSDSVRSGANEQRSSGRSNSLRSGSVESEARRVSLSALYNPCCNVQQL